MNTNYKKIKTYIKSIKKYQIKSIELNENNNKFEIISINYKLLNEDINNINKDLISALIKDKLCKELFFDKIEDVYIFNQNKFLEVMFNTNEYMDGSYTKYSSNIGLFLKDEDNIQLNFPYKDCILVGGMDKEDDKVNLEVLYNEILEKDKINKLFEQKVFHNIKKISYNKKLAENDKLDNPNNIQVDNNIDKIQFETIIDYNGIEKEKLKDNLLIKGNNLLGLHSLARRLSGTIDVIYIDPPYYFNDSDNDSFAYNSNFKLSIWLTFMKNRLEIAQELLSNTGIIFISIDNDGLAYLKLLCNDIFNNKNDGLLQVVENNPGGRSDNFSTATSHEYLLMYMKNKSSYVEEQKKQNKNNLQTFNFKIYDEIILKKYNLKDSISKYKKGPSLVKGGGAELVKDRPKMGYSIYYKSINDFKIIDETFLNNNNKYERKEEFKELINNGYIRFIPPNKIIDKEVELKRWRWGKEKFERKIGDLIFNLDNKMIYTKDRLFNNYKLEKQKSIFKKTSFTTARGKKDFEELELYNFPFPKSKSFLKRIFEISSFKNATILDFFAGSGTTAHSVLSLNKEDGGNRKFILLEQMDYIENITAERIKRCMIKENYEDSFIYMEMKESEVKELKNQIKNSKDKDELISLINDNFDKGYFINIDNKEQLLLKIEEIYNKIIQKTISKTNTIQKFNDQFLLESIKLIIEKHMDNNLDYVSYEDIEELKLSNKIKDNEYRLNKSFYQVK